MACAASQNRCDQNIEVVTKSKCHSCSLTSLVQCPDEYTKSQPERSTRHVFMCAGITSPWLCLSRAVRSSVTKTRWSPSAVQVTGAMTALSVQDQQRLPAAIMESALMV